MGWIYASVNLFTNSFWCKLVFHSSCFSRLSSVAHGFVLCGKGCCLSHAGSLYRRLQDFRQWLIWTVSRRNIHSQKHKRESGQMSSGKSLIISSLAECEHSQLSQFISCIFMSVFVTNTLFLIAAYFGFHIDLYLLSAYFPFYLMYFSLWKWYCKWDCLDCKSIKNIVWQKVWLSHLLIKTRLFNNFACHVST